MGPSDSCYCPTVTQLTKSLHDLPCLQRLSFEIGDAFVGITDAELQALEDVWPQLISFEMIYPASFRQKFGGKYEELQCWKSGKLPTFETLAAFVSAHPQLERLSLPYLDARSLPARGGELEGPSISEHGLRLLRVVYFESKLSLVNVAVALDRLFPHLEVLSDREYVECPGDELESLILALQLGRRGEIRAD